MNARTGACAAAFIGLAIGVVHGCSDPPKPPVRDRVNVTAKPSTGRCLTVTGDGVSEICLSEDPARRGTRIDLVLKPAIQCVRVEYDRKPAVIGKRNYLAFVDPTDIATRRIVELEGGHGSASFVIGVDVPEDAAGPQAFARLAGELSGRVSIDTFTEPCSGVCRELTGVVTVEIDPAAGVTGHPNIERGHCEFLGPKSIVPTPVDAGASLNEALGDGGSAPGADAGTAPGARPAGSQEARPAEENKPGAKPATKPDAPLKKPDAPLKKPDAPLKKPDAPAKKPDTPARKADGGTG